MKRIVLKLGDWDITVYNDSSFNINHICGKIVAPSVGPWVGGFLDLTQGEWKCHECEVEVPNDVEALVSLLEKSEPKPRWRPSIVTRNRR